MTPTKATPKRRRHPKVESYADWMARVDQEVDSMAREMERRPPNYAGLHPAQRRIVQMFIDYLRSLPQLEQGQDAFEKPEYQRVKVIMRELFMSKFPAWEKTERNSSGGFYVDNLPGGEGKTYTWILRNCAGRAPIEASPQTEDDDD